MNSEHTVTALLDNTNTIATATATASAAAVLFVFLPSNIAARSQKKKKKHFIKRGGISMYLVYTCIGKRLYARLRLCAGL